MNPKYRTGRARFWAAMIDGLVFLPLILVERILILPTDNKVGFILWQMFCITFACGYSVILHARYGQTLGKYLMRVKLMDISELSPITLKQAIMRDIVGIVINCAALIYLMVNLQNTDLITDRYDDFMQPWASIWLWIELITMLSNRKRRAVHDFIAGTVVIKLNKKKSNSQ
jgi:uncharacterized RDD family membrane protein YckC